MSLETFWFIVVAFFWTGFFVLEGFDFGVGVLHTVVGRDEHERRVALNAIGPFWDGNEVWLIVAGAGDVRGLPRLVRDAVLRPLPRAAADPGRADRARGLVRVPRARSDAPRWQRTWTWATTLGSGAIPLLLGIGLGGMVAGLPIDADGEYTGGVRDIFTAYGVWTGLTLLSLSVAARRRRSSRSRPTGAVRERARTLGVPPRAGRGRRRRSSSPSGGRPCSASLAAAAVIAAGALLRAGPRGLGLRRLRGRDGRHGQLAVRRPLPERAGLQHRRRLQPHRLRRRLGLLRAEGDDRRRRRLRPARPALPGLDLPRVPRARRSLALQDSA